MSTYFNTIIKATLMQFSKSEQSICRPSMTETSFVCRGTTIIIKINQRVYSRRGIIGFELNTSFSFHTKGLDSPHFLSFFKTQMGKNFKKWKMKKIYFFVITSSKLVRNWFCKKHLVRNHIFHNYCFIYVL